MEAQEGKVAVTINGNFPAKYMKRKAVVEVQPQIRWEGGRVASSATAFQGEKVKENNRVIAYKAGGSYTLTPVFAYTPEMQQSELYLTFKARKGKKEVIIPDVKVADGVVATSELYHRTLESAAPSLSKDAYQRIVEQKQQADIKFLIQQSKIRNSELKKTSVADFVQTLRDIKADEQRKNLGNIEVSAYASPDGGLKLNDKLAAEREKVTNKALANILKKDGISADVDTKYTAQDWEGFQELVKASNMQDKEVILSVLSMYKDPQQREEQIKNISSAFRELADEVLPQLRRSRLTLNYQLVGRSDEEIKAQVKEDASQLSVEEQLYGASILENRADKKDLYKKCAIQYDDYRAYNNLSALALEDGQLAEAREYANRALAASANAPEVCTNAGLLALREGNSEKAMELLSKGSGAASAGEALGNYYLSKGDYEKALSAFQDCKSNSAALAQLLTKNYTKALSTLSAVNAPDATTSYLKAIIAARTGNKGAVLSNLDEAIKADATYRDYAKKDLEFSALRGDAQFLNILK